MKPALSFAVELDSPELVQLFKQPELIQTLKQLDASLCLGIKDLSAERAAVVQQLNHAGIQVIAWLLLPEDEGYWFNINNHQQAAARYLAFKQWSDVHQLRWAGIGLDIEPDIKEMAVLVSKPLRLLPVMLQRYLDVRRLLRAKYAFQQLVDHMRADGFMVESYHLPLIADDRKARATVVQRLLGVVDVDVDRDVLMLYASFFRPHGEAILSSYAAQTNVVGVGSTGGGVQIDGVITVAPLRWEEFSQSLKLSHAAGKPIFIFSLEGCVQQGFLTRLVDFDWEAPVAQTHPQPVHLARGGLHVVLWLLQRPWVILLSLLSVLGVVHYFKHKRN